MEYITLISFIGGESVRDAEREVQWKEPSFYCHCCLPLQLGSKNSLLFGELPFVHLRRHSPMTRTLYLLIDTSTADHNIFDLLLLLSSFTARLQEQSALWRTPFVHLRRHSPMARTPYLLIDTSTAAHNIFDLSFYRLRASQSLSYFKAHGLETHPNFLY